jgi:uncharacterized protein YgiM (DUF1202 family)
MKRIILVAVMAVACLTMMAQGRCFASVHDADGYVNVRKSMSTSSSIQQRLDDGAFVYISPTGSNWYHVSLSATGPYIGYVYYDRVRVVFLSENKYEATWHFRVTDSDGYTNVRQSATTKSSIVKKLKKGEYFDGKYAVDADGWIGVFDNKGILIGFVYHTKVQRLAVLQP